MLKSKNATIIVIIFILIYGIFANFKLQELGSIYTYIINPIFWIILAIAIRILLGKSYKKKRLKKDIIQYTLIAILVYILVYLISGIFVTFGENPYERTLVGLITNLWIFGTVIISREYIRYKLINNVYEKDKLKIGILILVVYAIIEFGIKQLFTTEISLYSIMKKIGSSLMPILAKNALYTYVAIYSDYIPNILYEFTTTLFIWISPILPNSPWIMFAIIDTTIPIILFLYIRYIKNKKDIFRTRQDLINADPRNIIPLAILIILGIWFAIGIFPIKPVSIASGSMKNELCVGDVAIVKKCNSNDIIEGDIIEYQMEGFTVVHRVINKTQKNGEFYFTTKGDNNSQEDSELVREDQLIGKVIFKIRYIGYPAIWLHNLRAEEQTQIETGN